jgi:hypothetical protein
MGDQSMNGEVQVTSSSLFFSAMSDQMSSLTTLL